MGWFKSTPETEALLAEERLVLDATEAVNEAMLIAGKNKQQLAELLNVKPSEISQRLSGRRNLTLRSLARMLHVLGVRAELTLAPARTAESEHHEHKSYWHASDESGGQSFRIFLAHGPGHLDVAPQLRNTMLVGMSDSQAEQYMEVGCLLYRSPHDVAERENPAAAACT